MHTMHIHGSGMEKRFSALCRPEAALRRTKQQKPVWILMQNMYRSTGRNALADKWPWQMVIYLLPEAARLLKGFHLGQLGTFRFIDSRLETVLQFFGQALHRLQVLENPVLLHLIRTRQMNTEMHSRRRPKNCCLFQRLV